MKLSVREMVLVSMFAALACVPGLMVKFGLKGLVPFSLLPFVSMLAGVLLGGRLAAMSMLVYLLVGLAGVPVFAAPPYGGLTYLVKPTAGFLFGFIAGAYLTGTVVEKIGRHAWWSYFAGAAAGLAVIYLIGLPYLYVIVNFYVGKAIDILGVLKVGFLPFIGFDLLKALAASVIAVPVARQVKVLTGKVA